MRANTERVRSMGDYLGMLRRRMPTIVSILPGAILVSVFIAFVLPAEYSASATILKESSTIDPTLVKTAVVIKTDEQLELVQRAVMTNDRLKEIVKQVDPYPDLKDLSAGDKAKMIADDTSLQRVDPVTMQPTDESAAFTITYTNPSPELAADVAQRLADMFLAYNRETRTAQARAAYDFLLGKSKEIDAQIRVLAQKIAEFKEVHGDALPDALSRNEGSLDRTQRDLDAAEAQVRLFEQQETLAKQRLDQTSPNLKASTDVYTQLATLRAQLAEAQQKYTPDHPDVKRLTRAIEALAAQASLGNAGAQGIQPDNPDYIRIASDLQAIRTNLEAARATANRARMQLADYERRVSQAPVVERDYVQLTRDREIALQQFESIQAKLRDAEMGTSLESQAQGDRYTVIKKPWVPTKPSAPNRLGIMLLGVVLGGAAAVALAAIRESADPTVRSILDVAEVTTLPTLGAIPPLRNRAERRHWRWVWGGVGAIYTVAASIVAFVVVRA